MCCPAVPGGGGGGADGLTDARFARTELSAVKEVQNQRVADVEKEMEGLRKKEEYLDTTQRNAKSHLERILGGGGV